MISLVVVAGPSTKELCTHLENNCSFKIAFQAQSLFYEKERFKNAIIKADKLLYVYQKESANIRNDMAFLRELFIEDSFFKTKEVLFVLKKDADAEQAQKYFINVMQDVNTFLKESNSRNEAIEYYCKIIDGSLTFQAISDVLLGVSQAAPVHNTISKFYRYEKGTTAKEIYVPEQSNGASVEAFNFDSLVNYNREQKNMKNMPSVIVETNDSDSWDTFSTISLNKLKDPDAQDSVNVTIVTGQKKAGKTVLATALAKSLAEGMQRTLFLDLSDNKDCIERLENTMSQFDCVEVQDVLFGLTTTETVTVALRITDEYADLSLDVVTLLADKLMSDFDNVIIVCEEDLCLTLERVLLGKVSKVIYCLFPLKKDLATYKEPLEELSLYSDVLIALSHRLQLGEDTSYLTQEEVKDSLGDFFKVMQEIDYDTADITESFSKQLL